MPGANVPGMRKFVCQFTKAEATDSRILVTFERICVEMSPQCALQMAAACVTTAAKVMKAAEKPTK